MPISLELKKRWRACCCSIMVDKGAFLLREGQTCTNKWFVKKGLAKAFEIGDEGKEHIVGFHLENTFMTQLDSYEQQVPSSIYIQAVEPMVLLGITRQQEQELLKHPEYVKLQYLLGKQELLASYQIQRQITRVDALGRYQFLMQHFPQIIQKAKLKDIAAFMGISQEQLSRIRKAIS